MEYLPRPITSCGFRTEVREEAGVETARCGLLAKILGAADAEVFRVRRDACRACCQAQPPLVERINPVVASLLFPRAGVLAERGADAGRMAAIRQRAERFFEVEIPAEEAIPPWPRRASVACGYRGESIAKNGREAQPEPSEEVVFACQHPGHETTTEAHCRRCRDWAEVPGPAPPPLSRLVPAPDPRQGPAVAEWAVGMTTAPRRQETIALCLDSLLRAGWSMPRLFVDSGADIARRFAHLPVTLHEPALGAWPNYYLGLAELLMREPAADAYLMVQDDGLFYDREDLRQYLEAVLWPDWPIAAVSLYCPMVYTKPDAGWHRLEGRWVYGAVGFVFPRPSAQRLIADLGVLGHRWSERNEGLANIDVVIGKWAERNKLPLYYPTPSLVQHVGDTSTLWPRARALGVRKADRFAGDVL